MLLVKEPGQAHPTRVEELPEGFEVLRVDRQDDGQVVVVSAQRFVLLNKCRLVVLDVPTDNKPLMYTYCI